jgi:predicted ATPase
MAITLLASLVRAASEKNQVIISTQSPLLLDHFEPEEVLVADRVDGSTQFTRLDKSKLEGWLKDYSLGQLWEKNELGGRPARN